MRLITTILLFWCGKLSAQTADYYGSSSGNDANNGKSKLTPKRTLAALAATVDTSTISTVRVAIEGGSVFQGGEGITLNRGKVFISSYNRDLLGKFHFPKLVGTDPFTTGWTLSGSNTYSRNIPNTFTDEMNGYGFMYVIEVDTLLEKTAPLTARHYLRRVASIAAVDNTVGSYFSASSAAVSPMPMYIHTSDGVSPNNHPQYRYDVVTRNNAVYRNAGGPYGGELNVENVFSVDFAQGSGATGTRKDSLTVNKCVSMGNGTHIGGGGNFSSYSNCGFICGDPTIMQYGIVFYQVDGAHETNTVQSSLFLDLPTVIYSHTSFGGGGGTNHGRINFHNNYVFNTTAAVVQSALTVDTFDVNNCYVKNSGTFLSSSEAGTTYLKNSVIENGTGLIQFCTNTVVENTLFRSKPAFSSAVILQTGHHTSITNSILHFKTTSSVLGTGARFFSQGDTSTRVTARYNIFICEIPTGSSCEFSTANNYGGIGTDKNTFDYNAYIIVSGSPIWKVSDASKNGSDPSVFTFANWKTQSGQDSHSVFIDLRNSGGDLKTVFVDPAAGNYNLANTPEANSIRAIGAGMTTPLYTFVSTPSREDILDTIERNSFVPVNQLFISPSTNPSRIQNLYFK